MKGIFRTCLLMSAIVFILTTLYQADAQVDTSDEMKTQSVEADTFVLPHGFNQKMAYWPDGNVRLRKIYDPYNNLYGILYYRDDGRLEKLEKYDSYGHKIAIGLYQRKGMLIKGPDGWAGMKWIYDGNTLRVQSYYDDRGLLMKRKYYDDTGRLVVTKYIGDAGLNQAEEMGMEFFDGHTNQYYDDEGKPEDISSLILR